MIGRMVEVSYTTFRAKSADVAFAQARSQLGKVTCDLNGRFYRIRGCRLVQIGRELWSVEFENRRMSVYEEFERDRTIGLVLESS